MSAPRHDVDTISRNPRADLGSALAARGKIECQRMIRRGGLHTRDSYVPRHWRFTGHALAEIGSAPDARAALVARRRLIDRRDMRQLFGLPGGCHALSEPQPTGR